jgi:hypothetical protein
MTSFLILPFKNDSTGAKILADNLPAERLDPHDSSSVRHCTRNHTVINWGCGWTNRFPVAANKPEAVCRAVNKLVAFEAFRNNDIPHPSTTTSSRVVKKWLGNGFNVYARETMEGERGRGITVLKPEDRSMGWEALPHVRSYVKGFPTHREFRVHVAFGQVIEVNEKKRRNGTNPDPLVRSSADWVFCVYNLAPYPETIKTAAIEAVVALGLDFGGVDLAIDSNDNVCVFEVNTAPWINRESSTVAYCNTFKEHFT